MADQYENKNAGELRDILKSITGELSRQRTIQAESAAEYRKMDSIARNLQDTTMGISNLTSAELDKLKQKNQSHIKELQYQAERLARQKIGAKFDGQINESLIDRLKYLGKLSTQEEAILRAASDNYEIEKQITAEVEDQYNKRLAFEKQVSKSLGVSGAIIGGIDGIMSKLGMNSGIFKDSIEESKKAMQEAAEAAARNGEYISKTSIMLKGLGPLAKGFGKALLDPLTILTAILEGFFRVNKASVEVQQLTGQYETSIAGVNDRLATSAQFLQTAAELTKQLGVSATLVFAPDQIAQLAEAKNLLGLSAEQAGRMGILMKTTGKSADEVGQGIYDTVNAYNGANRAAIAHGVVLQDVLSASDSITASLGKSEKKIGAAAVAARGLGLSLQEVDAIAGSLLNFEDSISNELEAQLLTGKDINLAKAREFAMSNDLEGLSKELAKNGASAAEFANMNRLEQESLAKALGMSRDQLAKSVLTQEAMNGMTDEQIAKARGVTLEQSKAMDVQQKMQVGMQKLAEAFAPLLDIIVDLVDAIMFFVKPIAQVIAMVTGNPIGKALLLAVVAANFLGVAVSGVGRAFGSMYQLGAKALTGLAGLFKKGGLSSALGGVKDKLMGGAKAAIPTPAAPTVPGAGKAGGGMMDSFTKINTTALIKAAAAMAIAAVGIFIFAKAIQELEKVKDWKNVAIGLGAFAVSMGVLAAVGNVAGPGLTALGAALNSFGAAMMTGYGAVGLAALTLAAIGLGYALNLAAPGIQAFGTVITTVFAGLATVIPVIVDGFVNLISAVVNGIGPLLLLGPALFGIAAGLGAVALAGLISLPAIGGLIVLSLAAPALVSLGMGGENKSAGEAKGKSEEGSMAGVEQKLDALIAAVKAGGNVYMDSNKVGRAQMLGSFKSA